MPCASAVLPAPSGPQDHQIAGAEQAGQTPAELAGVGDGREFTAPRCTPPPAGGHAATTEERQQHRVDGLVVLQQGHVPAVADHDHLRMGQASTNASECSTGVSRSSSPQITSTWISLNAPSASTRSWV